jgi:DNA polymerase III delta prime subunit
MRKILNILQAVSVSTNKITESDVNKCICYPTNKHSKLMFDSLMNENFNHSNKLIFDLIVGNGYSINDIISEMYNMLYDMIINNKQVSRVSKILELLKDIEYNLSLCTDDALQISAMVGVFKLSNFNNLSRLN